MLAQIPLTLNTGIRSGTEQEETCDQHDDVEHPFDQVTLVRKGLSAVEMPIAACPEDVAEPGIEERGD